jgi:hypothetical protein
MRRSHYFRPHRIGTQQGALLRDHEKRAEGLAEFPVSNSGRKNFSRAFGNGQESRSMSVIV